MRPSRWAAIAFWLLWIFLAYRAATGWMHPPPEKSLAGTWISGGREIACRADGSVRSGTRSTLVTWQGSRLVFSEPALTAALRDYGPDNAQWDFLLARQCGLVWTSKDTLDQPHVSHKPVRDTIEAKVTWTDKDHWNLDGVCYTRVNDGTGVESLSRP